MKKIIIKFLLAVMAAQILQAQGTVYLSNLDQGSAGSLAAASDSWLAAIFFTGTNPEGYALDSIELAMAAASGNPSNLTVMLYNVNIFTGVPGSSLGTLNGSLNPTTAGLYVYTPTSSRTLSPNAYYFIVLTAGTTEANGAYEWSHASSNSYNPSGGWNSVGGDIQTSGNGSLWSPLISDFPQYAIYATTVPEPVDCRLLLLGCGIWLYFSRMHKNGRLA